MWSPSGFTSSDTTVPLSALAGSCQLSGSESPYSTWHLMPLHSPTHTSTFSIPMLSLSVPSSLSCVAVVPLWSNLYSPISRGRFQRTEGFLSHTSSEIFDQLSTEIMEIHLQITEYKHIPSSCVIVCVGELNVILSIRKKCCSFYFWGGVVLLPCSCCWDTLEQSTVLRPLFYGRLEAVGGSALIHEWSWNCRGIHQPCAHIQTGSVVLTLRGISWIFADRGWILTWY